MGLGFRDRRVTLSNATLDGSFPRAYLTREGSGRVTDVTLQLLLDPCTSQMLTTSRENVVCYPEPVSYHAKRQCRRTVTREIDQRLSVTLTPVM